MKKLDFKFCLLMQLLGMIYGSISAANSSWMGVLIGSVEVIIWGVLAIYNLLHKDDEE